MSNVLFHATLLGKIGAAHPDVPVWCQFTGTMLLEKPHRLLDLLGGVFMSYLEAVKAGFTNYAKFNGRASRSEFWWFLLFVVIVYAVLYAIIGIFGGFTVTDANGVDSMSVTGVPFFILAIFWIALLLPVVGIQFRRLHDANHSAWWWLIGFVPFGGIVLIIFLVTPGTAGDNRFGPPVTTAVN